MIQLRGFLGRLLVPLLKTGLSLIRSVIQLLAESVLIPLRLTSAAHARIYKRILIISNDEMEDILKIVKSLEDSGLLLEGVSETIKKEAKEQKGGFLNMLLGTLGASLLGNMFAGKGVRRAGEGTARVSFIPSFKNLHFKKKLTPPHPLTNFEIQIYCQNEPR